MGWEVIPFYYQKECAWGSSSFFQHLEEFTGEASGLEVLCMDSISLIPTELLRVSVYFLVIFGKLCFSRNLSISF